MLEKVALVLFVKDEADEIAWWIAWHLSIGIDTLLIYDDRSSDGTWEIINAASAVLDVRCFRTPETLMFQHRQGQTYMQALDDHRAEFDWIGFLDGDEYLDLRHSPDMHHFLAQYPNVDGVAISWCCYGSNGHIVKPGPNVLECFLTHSKEEFIENRYVKSFIRPKNTRTEYYNPHKYAVEGRYVTPDGNDITWEPPLFQWSSARPDWSVALIRHFVIRSVEHYVEKFKRRGDLRTSALKMSFFNHYDQNDIVEHVDAGKLEKAYQFIYAIQHEMSRMAFGALRLNSSVTHPVGSSGRSFASPATVYKMYTSCDSNVAINKATGQMCHAFLNRASDKSLETAFAFINDNDLAHIYITSTDSKTPIHCSYDSRVSAVMAYEIVTVSDNRIALRCANTKKFVCFSPAQLDDPTLTGSAEANREWASDWETIELRPLHLGDNFPINIFHLSEITRNWPPEFSGTLEDKDAADYLADGLIAKLSTLHNNEILKWKLDNEGTEMPWVQNNARISF